MELLSLYVSQRRIVLFLISFVLIDLSYNRDSFPAEGCGVVLV